MLQSDLRRRDFRLYDGQRRHYDSPAGLPERPEAQGALSVSRASGPLAGRGSKGAFRAAIRIQADDLTGLVNKIAEVINRDLKINIRSMSLNSSGGTLSGLINIEVTSTQVVDAVIYSLMRIKGVQKVFRVNN